LREYETIFVLDSALEGDNLEGEIDRVVKLIEEKSGQVHEVQRWGRRRLAYPIQKKTDGVYTYVRFDGNNELLAELDRRYTLSESTLRHMTVLIDHPHAKAVSPIGVGNDDEEDDRDYDRRDRRDGGYRDRDRDGGGGAATASRRRVIDDDEEE
jgi:small subunit ribosomal protein S6